MRIVFEFFLPPFGKEAKVVASSRTFMTKRHEEDNKTLFYPSSTESSCTKGSLREALVDFVHFFE